MNRRSRIDRRIGSRRKINRLLAAVTLAACLYSANLVWAADEEKPATIATHQRWVTSVAFLPDGTLASAGGESLQFRPGEVVLWNSATGGQIAKLTEGGHPTNVWSLSASNDGKTLVSTGYDGKVIVWDVEKRAPRATLEKHKGWVRSSAFRGDGKQFATGGEDGSVIVWSLDGEIKETKSIEAHETAVYGLAFSPDGKTLATASTDKTAKLWNLESDAEPVKLEGHEDAVWEIAFAADGQRLATCGADRKIKLWGGDGKEQATLEGHRDWVSDVAFSPDGSLLASAAHDRTVRLWNVEKKAEEAVFENLGSTVWSVGFSADGKILAAGSHKSLRLWQVGDRKELFPPQKAEEKEE